MKEPNLIFSNKEQIPSEEINNSLILGQKAYGLFLVPSEWVPEFVVFTKYFYQKWKSLGINRAFENIFPDEKENFQLFLKEMEKTNSQVLIRSNSPFETIESSSGKYFSESVLPNLNQVLSAIDRLCSVSTEQVMFVIVQRCIDRSEIIHASNERRVSQDKFHWRIEGLREDRFIKITKETKNQTNKHELNAKDEKEVLSCLRSMFSQLIHINTGIFHCEIAWDGKNIWLVQADEIFEQHSSESANKYLTSQDPLGKDNKKLFKLLLPFQNVNRNVWKKLDRVHIFQDLDFPTADVFLLSGKTWNENYSLKENPLANEISLLLDKPIIIRTDIKTTALEEDMLLLTSEPIHNLDEAFEFMKKAQDIFSKKNIPESDWAFLFSNIYRVRACAMVHARPYSKTIQIDAVWGFADGLSYLPHDTYFIDVQSKKIVKNIEYKNSCLIGVNDKWKLMTVEKPLDWQTVLNNQEIRTISDWGLRLAKYLDKEVQLMIFAHISGYTGIKSIIPWHFTTFQLSFPEKVTVSPNSDKSIIHITNSNDLLRLKSFTNIKGIYLWPDVEEMRNKDFIITIAKIAAENKIPIIFEGSLLGHAYYAMVREGATVLASKQPPPPKEIIKYNKLVRDEIPAIVKRTGSIARVKTLLRPEAILFLKQKLIEEAFEVWNTSETNIAGELADVLEIIYSLSENLDIPLRIIDEIKEKKLKERGGFKKYIYLEETIYQQIDIAQREKGKIPLLFDEDIDSNQFSSRRSNKSSKLIRGVDKSKDDLLAFEIPLIPIIQGGKAISVLQERYKDFEIILEYHGQYMVIRVREPGEIQEKFLSDQLRLFD